MLFFGILIFLFLIIIRPQDFGPELMGAGIVFYVMLVLLIAWLLSSVPKKMFRTAEDRFFGLFFLSIVISTVTVNWITYSIDTAIETFKVALIYFFVVTVIDNDKKFKIASWTLVILMAIVGGISILQYHGHDITGMGMLWSSTKESWQIRGVGIFDNPNDIAYSVVLVIPFALGLFFQSKNAIGRGSAIILLWISSYTVYLTRSRGGYLAAIFCIVTWLYLRTSKKYLRRSILILGLIGIIISFSIQTKGYRDDKSAMGRIEAWAAGMTMLQNHPIIGVGKGQFIEYHERDSHNSYVRAGAELGVIGLYAFLGIIYSAFLSLIKEEHRKLSIDWKLYRVSYASFIAAFALASIFSTRTYDIVFLVVIAFTGILKRFSMDELEDSDGEVVVLSKESLWNKYVFASTILIIIIWKLFLIQVW